MKLAEGNNNVYFCHLCWRHKRYCRQDRRETEEKNIRERERETERKRERERERTVTVHEREGYLPKYIDSIDRGGESWVTWVSY